MANGRIEPPPGPQGYYHPLPPQSRWEPPRRESSNGGLMFLVSIILIIVAAGFGGAAYIQYGDLENIRSLQTKVADLERTAEILAEEPQREIARLEETVTALEARLQTAEARAESDDDSLNESALREIQSLSEGLEGKISGAASAAAQALHEIGALREETRNEASRIESQSVKSLETATASLAERIEHLERANINTHHASPAGAVALAQLSLAMQGTEPFLNVLAAYEQATGRTLSGEFRTAAQNGVPDRSLLLETFRDALRAVAREKAEGTDAKTPLDRAKAWAGGLVSIRPSDATAGSDEQAILSRVEARLVEGNLDAAINEMESLPLPLTESLESWLANVRRRASIEAEYHRILAEITADSG